MVGCVSLVCLLRDDLLAVYPIDEILGALKDAVTAHPGVVLSAPPGAGKTTRVPIALLDVVPRDCILLMEPRRLAATSAARWMAMTLHENVGETVGYSIRFDSRRSSKTRVEVVTGGILTRRLQSDPSLHDVAMVIFDEFHERSIDGDLALALCLDIQRNLREELKILVMSATLDCKPIAALLGGAPVIASKGRIFPVEERYGEEKAVMPLHENVVNTVSRALGETEGDILAFLPGVREIRRCHEALREVLKTEKKKIAVQPLYGDLPFEDQERAILPSQYRKIVLATNIAETSLTIEGIRVVIDSGLTRRLQYDPSSGMNRLITGSASKASAEQRKGRAGRLGPGICYRLYGRHTFQSMLPFAPPEILISDLSSLVLELAIWGVKEPSGLSWLDVPPDAAWKSAERLLMDMDLLDRSGAVTERGRIVAGLPLHPRLGCLLMRSVALGCPELGADLAALLSERDILLRSVSRASDTDISERLDILWRWRKTKEPSASADIWALRTVDRTAGHLMHRLRGAGKRPVRGKNFQDAVARLLLSAFPDRIARKRDKEQGRFVLGQGRGVRVSTAGSLATSTFIIAVNLDLGNKSEGSVHIAEPLTEDIIREACRESITTVRRVSWYQREKKIIAVREEQLGALLLSSVPIIPSDEEVSDILCSEIRSDPGMLGFSREARQFQARVLLLRRAYPEEDWPDLSDEHLYADPKKWLRPWLGKVRSAEELSRLDLVPALRQCLTRSQQLQLADRAPAHVVVPSGNRIALDYTAGELPVLAVKLQEMFKLADTPTIASGRIKVLIHLLSPAGRPVQVTQDLRGFWNSGYQQVKKELKGRYPRHPWPEDPWNALPTRKIKPRGK